MSTALPHLECPRCDDRWYEDIEPETGFPYTCFFCGNGSVRITAEMIAEDAAPELSTPRNEIT